jgi:hypothetical protein
LAKKLSAVFRGHAEIYRGAVNVYEERGNRYLVSTEGAFAAEPFSNVRVSVSASTQADDGMPLFDTIGFTAPGVDQLPPDAEMVAQVEKLSRELSDLRKAPIVDDYSGPVLFRGAAAGQVVRAMLAEDFSGTPAPKGDHPGARSIGESALVSKLGQRILPVGTSVVDDPTLEKLAGQRLSGHYQFDDEGIAAQKVSLVENGIFKRFLMSRTPRKGFDHSTGHGRSTPMSPVRAHPANLIVTSTKGVSDREIAKRALAAAKEQELPYVLVVDRLASDFDPSMFSRDGSSIGKPALLRRLYLDGHEQLVRGATFGAVPLNALKQLIAIGSTSVPYQAPGVIPVSIVCPPLLFRDVDVKKPHGAQRKLPIAPRPSP